jgi:Fur family ferric uptake transcriptional regulator
MDECKPEIILKNKNLKVTKQRMLILTEMLEYERPLSANDLHFKFNHAMDLATIYRILCILKEHNILREITSKEEIKYYELSCIHHPIHPHFFCNSCGKLYCLKILKDDDLKSIRRYGSSFAINEININLNGLCRECK